MARWPNDRLSILSHVVVIASTIMMLRQRGNKGTSERAGWLASEQEGKRARDDDNYSSLGVYLFPHLDYHHRAPEDSVCVR